jgi:predicted nucleotidyltransferase
MSQESIAIVESILIEELKPFAAFIVLFGSSLTDRFSKSSDIDCGVYLTKNHEEIATDFEKLATLKANLELRLKRQIDLVFLNFSDLIIAMQIVKTGKLLLDSKPTSYFPYKQRVISEYIDFKISRRGIEKALING